jgi:hypothetical protein
MRLLHRSSDNDIDEGKKFSERVLGIGDDSIGDVTDENIHIEILDDLLIHSSGDHIASIVDCIYPSILSNMNETSFFEHRAILTPKNGIVDEINEYVINVTYTW